LFELNLQNCDVSLRVTTDNLCRVFAIVLKGDFYFSGVADDMTIGHDITRRINDEARAEGNTLGRVSRHLRKEMSLAPLTLLLEKAAQKLVERRIWEIRRGVNSGSSDMASASARRDTEYIYDAGETSLTRGQGSGAGSAQSATSSSGVSFALVAAGSPQQADFRPRTKGDRARVAPSRNRSPLSASVQPGKLARLSQVLFILFSSRTKLVGRRNAAKRERIAGTIDAMS